MEVGRDKCYFVYLVRKIDVPVMFNTHSFPLTHKTKDFSITGIDDFSSLFNRNT
jgi:hypothetical protein